MTKLPDEALILLPVRNVVLFPGLILPIVLGRGASIAAAQEAVRKERPLGVVLQKRADVDAPGPEDLYRVGTIAKILRYVTAPDDTHHVIAQGADRFQIVEFLEGGAFLAARIEVIRSGDEVTPEIEARAIQLRERAVEALQLSPEAPAEAIGAVQSVPSPAMLTDLVASFTQLEPDQRQELLETFDLKARMDKVLELLRRRIEVLRLSREIGEKAKS